MYETFYEFAQKYTDDIFFHHYIWCTITGRYPPYVKPNPLGCEVSKNVINLNEVTKSNMKSLYDMYKDYCKVDIICETYDTGSSWLDIKKKSIKNLMIANYVIKQKEDNNQSLSEMYKNLNTIMTGMMFKTITHKDIEFDNDTQQIININTKHIDINSKDTQVSKSSNKSSKKTIKQMWTKFNT